MTGRRSYACCAWLVGVSSRRESKSGREIPCRAEEPNLPDLLQNEAALVGPADRRERRGGTVDLNELAWCLVSRVQGKPGAPPGLGACGR